jgi:hypothetical protein
MWWYTDRRRHGLDRSSLPDVSFENPYCCFSLLGAPHSIYRPDLVFALVGRYDTLDPFDNVEVVAITEQFPNPDWDSETRENDYMVLLLSRSVQGYVRINLDENLEIDIIIGFGRTNLAVYSPPQFLQELTVEFVPNDECKRAKERGFSYKDLISDDMMCLSGIEPRSGQCQGDSGGPVLLLDENEEDLQVAIMSWYGIDSSVETVVHLNYSNILDGCIIE